MDAKIATQDEVKNIYAEGLEAGKQIGAQIGNARLTRAENKLHWLASMILGGANYEDMRAQAKEDIEWVRFG